MLDTVNAYLNSQYDFFMLHMLTPSVSNHQLVWSYSHSYLRFNMCFPVEPVEVIQHVKNWIKRH